MAIQIALGEGGAADHLEVVVLTLKLDLTRPKLHVLFLTGVVRIQVVISDKYALGTTESDLIGTAVMQIELFID